MVVHEPFIGVFWFNHGPEVLSMLSVGSERLGKRVRLGSPRGPGPSSAPALWVSGRPKSTSRPPRSCPTTRPRWDRRLWTREFW
jgi:hypothetical protein